MIRQTSRTTRSSSAYQPYWTGVVRAREVVGKLTFVPSQDVNVAHPASAGKDYPSVEWRRRQAAGPLEFRLYWIPFLNEDETPLKDLTKEWAEQHKVPRRSRRSWCAATKKSARLATTSRKPGKSARLEKL